MSRRNIDPQRHRLEQGDQPGRLSRRRLLVTGTGALAGGLPVLAAATGVVAEAAVERSAATRVAAAERSTAIAATTDQASDRQRRIAAILERHGPELGSGR